MWITSNANARACPQIDCEIITGFRRGDAVEVAGASGGDTVSGSSLWYGVIDDSGLVYVHSSLLTDQEPAAAPVQPVAPQIRPTEPIAANLGQQSVPAQPTQMPAPTQAPPAGPQSPFGCNGVDDLNCSDFRAVGQSANAHLAQCGDEDRLDGDGDGRACE